MKKTLIFYWLFTGLFAFMMLGSAIPDMFSTRIAVEGFGKIGMPVYLLPFLGIAKTLGVIAILVPCAPRIKEWAYAGLMFDLAGATWCVFSSGERGGNLAFMIMPILAGVLSYMYYYRRQNMVAVAKEFP